MAIGRGRRLHGGVGAPSIGRAQIIQANAPAIAAAPLIQARAGSAAAASAGSIIQAPTPRIGGGGGGRWFGAPPTPKDRHDKLSGGRAGETSATRTADTPWSVEKDEYGGLKVGIRDAQGNLTNVRRVTKGEYESTIKRGAAGAHLNPTDLAIYRHHTGWKSEEEKAQEKIDATRAAEKEKIALKAQADAAAAEQKHKYAMERDKAKSAREEMARHDKEVAAQDKYLRENGYDPSALWRTEDRGKAYAEIRARKEAAAKAKIDAAAQRQQAAFDNAERQKARDFRRKAGVPEDDETISNEDVRKIGAGTHGYEFGRTNAEKEQIESLERVIDSDGISAEDKARLQKELDDYKEAHPEKGRAVELPEDKRRPQTTDIGGVMYFNNNGTWQPVQQPKADPTQATFKDYQSWKTAKLKEVVDEGEAASIDVSPGAFRKEWDDFHNPQTPEAPPYAPPPAPASTPTPAPTPAPAPEQPAESAVAPARQPVIGSATGTDWSQFEDVKEEKEEE